FFSSRRRHTRFSRDWSSDVCSSDLKKEFLQTKCIVVEVGNKFATIRHEIGVQELRPGGTVSGPVLMTMADMALYVAILGEIGIVDRKSVVWGRRDVVWGGGGVQKDV